MSDAAVIKQLTLNVATVFKTSAAIDRVQVHNDSSMYLRIYFGADAPTDPLGTGWHDTIGPGDHPLMWVVGASAGAFTDRTNYIQSTPYAGTITVMPFLPVGLPAPNGIINGAALCTLTAYYPHEYAEGGNLTEAYVQAAKQGRWQSVIGAANAFTTFNQLTDNTTPNNYVIPTGFILTSANHPALFAANAAGQSIINSYLNEYVATMRSRTPAMASCDIGMSWALCTAGFVPKVLGSIVPIMLVANGFGMDRFQLKRTTPILMRVFVPQGQLTSGDVLAWVFLNGGGFISPQTTGSYQIAHAMSIDIDVLNISALRNIAPNHQTGQDAAWNAVYNPQIY